MSWQNHNLEVGNTETETERVSKIRKRGCSSSSSSSLVRRYRFKRAILVGKRCGSSTPFPTWKTSVRSPSLVMEKAEFPKLHSSKGKEVSLSARKLAATLWEINEVPSASLQVRLERSGGGSHQRRTSAISHKLQLNDYCLGGLDSISNASLMEIESHSLGRTHHKGVTGIKTRLKEVSNGLTTSKELVKVLNHVWGIQEQRSSSMSILSALHVELDRAREQVDQLIREQRSNRNEIDHLMKHFAEEKAAWKIKEREKIRDAIVCVAEELEVEKKLRRQTERLNKKLGKELASTKSSMSKAMKELEREKRGKEILEQICDELARGIGEDKAQVEELKRESVKVREEVEKEREMLQLADAVENLRNELEAYLRTKVGKENGDRSPKFEKIKELEAYLKKINFGSSQIAEKEHDDGEVADGEECEGDDSAESDLHSIELNMDNDNKSYKWSYACGDDAQNDSKGVVDYEFKARKSISEKIQWGNICLNRATSNGKKLEFGRKSRDNSDGFDQDRLSEFLSQAQTQDHEDEIKRYRSVKDLRDHILSGSKIALVQSFASPTWHWDQSLPLQGADNEAWESSLVLQGDDSKPKIDGTRGECQT
uniref:Uncharacterized protein n=1 Tax=Fagus sylvatica TaxID=28930 RepID=A0A2N9INR4_FAGSY